MEHIILNLIHPLYCKLISTVDEVIVNLGEPLESVKDEPIPTLPLILTVPFTSNAIPGKLEPIPTFPAAVNRIFSDADPKFIVVNAMSPVT